MNQEKQPCPKISTFLSCKNATEREAEQIQIAVDSTGLKIENEEKPTKNSKLISFLENPRWCEFTTRTKKTTALK